MTRVYIATLLAIVTVFFGSVGGILAAHFDRSCPAAFRPFVVHDFYPPNP